MNQLSKGSFIGGFIEIFDQAGMRIRKAEKLVQATYLSATKESLYSWHDLPVVANYYKENNAARTRNAKIERIFTMVNRMFFIKIEIASQMIVALRY
ncbi:MAG: hypothetical protein V2J62_04745 [candidate division KSB1 bacterium]|nr:hypothetical protein [candidate division KSB1 bacterium]